MGLASDGIKNEIQVFKLIRIQKDLRPGMFRGHQFDETTKTSWLVQKLLFLKVRFLDPKMLQKKVVTVPPYMKDATKDRN